MVSPQACDTAVCLKPGTELVFEGGFASQRPVWTMARHFKVDGPVVAKFAQRDMEQPCMHHDGFELLDGSFHYLHHLDLGTKATVLQLPAKPAEAKAEQPEPTGEQVVDGLREWAETRESETIA